MYDKISAGWSDGSDRCPKCGQRQTTASNRFGVAVALVMMALIAVIVLAPLLWVARVAFEWAAGIS